MIRGEMTLSESETKLAEALWSRYRQGGEEVIADVARLFHILPVDITGISKRAVFVDARSVVALILRHRAYKFAEIGVMLGNRDHSTIWHLCRRIEADPDLRGLALEMAA